MLQEYGQIFCLKAGYSLINGIQSSSIFVIDLIMFDILDSSHDKLLGEK